MKMLLSKWTIAVSATAIFTGKKMVNAGSKIAPSPKPEKKVSSETGSATICMTTNSTGMLLYYRNKGNNA